MAQQGAIIGQIQTGQPGQMQQVNNQTQIHQLQQNGQQTITMQQAPQQVQLPVVKTELMNEVSSADSASQAVNTSGESKDSSAEGEFILNLMNYYVYLQFYQLHYCQPFHIVLCAFRWHISNSIMSFHRSTFLYRDS